MRRMAVARQILDACRQPFEIDGRPAARRLQHRRRDRRSRQQRRAAAAQRRRRHVLGEVARQGPRARYSQPEMLRAARRRMRIENELATAIETSQLEAHYQPIVDLDFAAPGGRRGADALAPSDARTRVMPRRFHPARRGDRPDRPDDAVDAESRLRGRRAAAARACRMATGLRVSVNVSSRYLNHGNVAEEVRRALDAHGLRRRLPDPRSHREPAARELHAARAHLPGAQDDRRAPRARRLRHRLFLARVSASLPDRHPQDRPFVRRAAGARQAAAPRAWMPWRSRGDPLAGRRARPRHRRRRHRARGAARHAAALGCKTGQGYAFGKAMPVAEISTPRSRAVAACWPATCRARSSTPPPAASAA